MNAYEARAAMEVEHKRRRRKEAVMVGEVGVKRATELTDTMIDPNRERPRLRNEDPDDEPLDAVGGGHIGELVLEGDDYLPSTTVQYEEIGWSAWPSFGVHKVQIVEEWRRDDNHRRNPTPPHYCSCFAAERVDGHCRYIGCDQPLPLDWPEPQCEFPYQPRQWWRDDRPAKCHCNGCLTHPRGYGRRYCPDHLRTFEYARNRRDNQLQGKATRAKRTEFDRAADKRVRHLKPVTEL